MHKHDINKTGENTNANPPKVRGPWHALIMPNHKSVSPVLIAINLPDTVRYCSELFDFELVNCGGPAVKLVYAGNANSNIVSCITNSSNNANAAAKAIDKNTLQSSCIIYNIFGFHQKGKIAWCINMT